MTWDVFVANWPDAFARLQQRLPAITPDIMPSTRETKSAFAAYVADRNALTLSEAEETLDDILAFDAPVAPPFDRAA